MSDFSNQFKPKFLREEGKEGGTVKIKQEALTQAVWWEGSARHKKGSNELGKLGTLFSDH